MGGLQSKCQIYTLAKKSNDVVPGRQISNLRRYVSGQLDKKNCQMEGLGLVNLSPVIKL